METNELQTQLENVYQIDFSKVDNQYTRFKSLLFAVRANEQLQNSFSEQDADRLEELMYVVFDGESAEHLDFNSTYESLSQFVSYLPKSSHLSGDLAHLVNGFKEVFKDEYSNLSFMQQAELNNAVNENSFAYEIDNQMKFETYREYVEELNLNHSLTDLHKDIRADIAISEKTEQDLKEILGDVEPNKALNAQEIDAIFFPTAEQEAVQNINLSSINIEDEKEVAFYARLFALAGKSFSIQAVPKDIQNNLIERLEETYSLLDEKDSRKAEIFTFAVDYMSKYESDLDNDAYFRLNTFINDFENIPSSKLSNDTISKVEKLKESQRELPQETKNDLTAEENILLKEAMTSPSVKKAYEESPETPTKEVLREAEQSEAGFIKTDDKAAKYDFIAENNVDYVKRRFNKTFEKHLTRKQRMHYAIKNYVEKLKEQSKVENPFSSPVFEYFTLLTQEENTDPLHKKVVSKTMEEFVKSDPMTVLTQIPVLEEHLQETLEKKQKLLQEAKHNSQKQEIIDDIELIQNVLERKDQVRKIAEQQFQENLRNDDSIKNQAIINVATKNFDVKEDLIERITALKDSGIDADDTKRIRAEIAQDLLKGDYAEELRQLVKENHKEALEEARKELYKDAEKQLRKEQNLYRKMVGKVIKENVVEENSKVLMFGEDAVFDMLKNAEIGHQEPVEAFDLFSNVATKRNLFGVKRRDYYVNGRKGVVEKRFGGLKLTKDLEGEDRVKAMDFCVKKLLKKSDRVNLKFAKSEPIENRNEMVKNAAIAMYDKFSKQYGEVDMITHEQHLEIKKQIRKNLSADGLVMNEMLEQVFKEVKHENTQVRTTQHFEPETIDKIVKELQAENPEFEGSELQSVLELRDKNNSINDILRTTLAIQSQIQEESKEHGSQFERDLADKKLENVIETLQKAKITEMTQEQTKKVFEKRTQSTLIDKVNFVSKNVRDTVSQEVQYFFTHKTDLVMDLIEDTARMSNKTPEQVSIELMAVGDDPETVEKIKADYRTNVPALIKQSNKLSNQFRNRMTEYFHEGFEDLEKTNQELRRNINVVDNNEKFTEMYQYLKRIKDLKLAEPKAYSGLLDEKKKYDGTVEFMKKRGIEYQRLTPEEELAAKKKKEEELKAQEEQRRSRSRNAMKLTP